MSHIEHGAAFDREINTRAIVRFVVGLAVLVAVTALLMLWMLGILNRQRTAENPPPSPLPEANERWQPPGPKLQEFPPTADIQTLRRYEEQHLGGRDWVDEEAGIVRIPIEDAMRVLAEKGLPQKGQIESSQEELFGEALPPAADEGEAP